MVPSVPIVADRELVGRRISAQCAVLHTPQRTIVHASSVRAELELLHCQYMGRVRRC